MTQIKIDVGTLKKLQSPTSVPQQALEILAANLEVQSVKRKTRIFEQDEPADRVYTIGQRCR